MTSHTKFGNFEVVLGSKGSIRFAKKPSRFSVCIGEKLRNHKYENREAVRNAFASAVAVCKPQSPTTEEVVETVE